MYRRSTAHPASTYAGSDGFIAPEEQDREVYRWRERAEPVQDYLPRLYPSDVRVGGDLRGGRRCEAEQDHAEGPQHLGPVADLVWSGGAKSQVSGVGEQQRDETPVHKHGETVSDPVRGDNETEEEEGRIADRLGEGHNGLAHAPEPGVGRRRTEDEVPGERPDREHDRPCVEAADQRDPARR